MPASSQRDFALMLSEALCQAQTYDVLETARASIEEEGSPKRDANLLGRLLDDDLGFNDPVTVVSAFDDLETMRTAANKVILDNTDRIAAFILNVMRYGRWHATCGFASDVPDIEPQSGISANPDTNRFTPWISRNARMVIDPYPNTKANAHILAAYPHVEGACDSIRSLTAALRRTQAWQHAGTLERTSLLELPSRLARLHQVQRRRHSPYRA